MPDDTTTTAPLSLPTTKPPPKPGYKTTEFYAAWFVKLLGALLASGLLGTGTPAERIAGGLMALLAQIGYTGARTLVKTAPALVLLFAMALAGGSLTACGANASQQRQTTLQAALVTTDTACATFAAYDLKHQEDLKAAAHASGATNAEVTDTVAKWRAARAPALKACKTVLLAIKAGATITDDQSIKAMTAAAGVLADALRILGVKR